MTGGPPPPPPPSDRAKTIHNEQTKLTATLINGIALGFIVGGGVTTVLGLVNVPAGVDPIPLVLVWLLTGFILHMIGRLFLRSLL